MSSLSKFMKLSQLYRFTNRNRLEQSEKQQSRRRVYSPTKNAVNRDVAPQASDCPWCKTAGSMGCILSSRGYILDNTGISGLQESW